VGPALYVLKNRVWRVWKGMGRIARKLRGRENAGHYFSATILASALSGSVIAQAPAWRCRDDRNAGRRTNPSSGFYINDVMQAPFAWDIAKLAKA
jgi:hypothetical protein